MFRRSYRHLLPVAVLAVFLELRITESLMMGEWNWVSGETIGLLLAAALGSLLLAIPFVCLRHWGGTRRHLVILAAITGGTVVSVGLMCGDFEMGHFVTLPGWLPGSVLAACVLTVGSVIAISEDID